MCLAIRETRYYRIKTVRDGGLQCDTTLGIVAKIRLAIMEIFIMNSLVCSKRSIGYSSPDTRGHLLIEVDWNPNRPRRIL